MDESAFCQQNSSDEYKTNLIDIANRKTGKINFLQGRRNGFDGGYNLLLQELIRGGCDESDSNA